MKRKILSVMAVLLVCCTAMFMFAGCNSPDDQNKFGTLTVSPETELTLTIGDSKAEAFANLKFSFTPAEGATYRDYDAEAGEYKDVPIESWGPLSYAEACAKGMVSSELDTRTATESGKPRTIIFTYLQVTYKLKYTVKA